MTGFRHRWFCEGKDSANRMQSVKLAWTLCWDVAYFLQRYCKARGEWNECIHFLSRAVAYLMQRYLFLVFAKPDYLRFNLKLLVIARIRFATSECADSQWWAIGQIFPPRRGEQNPLMWGFIPHGVGEFQVVQNGMIHLWYINDTFM